MWDIMARWTAGRHRRRRLGDGAASAALTSPWQRGAGLVLLSTLVLWTLLRSFLALPQTLCLEQRCRMSRMWPSYVRYDIPSSTGLDAKYHLFLYREAPPGQDLAGPTGRPVLFVPGNAGSYGQVRSLASSTRHLYERGEGGQVGAQDNLEPDWWAVHFNEDFSAFHGETLREEAHYLNDAITFLRSRYPGVKSIPIVAHSMGGIVSRLATLEHNYQRDSIKTIITLSSPHAYPPVPLDKGVEDIYAQLQKGARDDPTMQRDILLISVSGGILDDQLSSEASLLEVSQVWRNDTSLHGFTSSLAALWSGVDHLAMMWCDQLRERVARGILRIEGRGRDLPDRRRAWQRVLGLPQQVGDQSSMLRDVLAQQSAESIEGLDQFDVQTYRVAEADGNAFEVITSLTVGVDMSFGPPLQQDVQALVLLCKTSQEAEADCRSIPPEIYELLPPSPQLHEGATGIAYPHFPDAELRYEVPGNGLRRVVLYIEELRRAGIVEVHVAKAKGASGLLLASFMGKPAKTSIAPGLRHPAAIALGQDAKQIGTREVIIEGIDNTLLAYDVIVEMSQASCAQQDSSSPMLIARSLSSGDTQYYPSLAPGQKHTLMLHGTSPYIQPSASSRHATAFTIMLDPCSRVQRLHITLDWRGSAGLLVSRYRAAIVAFPITVLLSVLAVVWRAYDQGSPLPSPTRAAVSHSVVVLPGLIGLTLAVSIVQIYVRSSQVLSGAPMGNGILNMAFGIPDSPFWLSTTLAVALWLAAYGLIIIVSLALDGLTFAMSKCIPTKTYQPLRQGRQGDDKSLLESVSKSALAGFTIITITVYFFMPVQFVNLVAFLVQLVAVSSIRGNDRHSEAAPHVLARDRTNQHLLLLNVYLWLLPLNAPALLVWVRNMLNGWYGRLGGADHYIITVLGFLLVTYISSSGHAIPRTRSRLVSKITFALILKSCILTALYGIRYTHICLREVNMTFLWLSAIWMYASFRAQGKSNPDEEVKSDDEVDNSLSAGQPAAYSNMPPGLIADQFDQLPESLEKSLSIGEKVQGYEVPDEDEMPTTENDSLASEGHPSKLDLLLQEYLGIVDAYTEARRTLADSLAQGAFQLSRAKMQIGQIQLGDRWDARMQATRMVSIDTKTAEATLQCMPQPSIQEKLRAEPESDNASEGLRRRRAEKSQVDAKPKETQDESQDSGEKHDKKQSKPSREAAPYDPLYQFCALPPPSLRQSQQLHVKALEALVGSSTAVIDDSPAGGLVNIQRRLLSLESAILVERSKRGQTEL